MALTLDSVNLAALEVGGTLMLAYLGIIFLGEALFVKKYVGVTF
jgi:hypothetical protein